MDINGKMTGKNVASEALAASREYETQNEIVDKDNENLKGKGKRNEGYIQQTDRTEETDSETIIR